MKKGVKAIKGKSEIKVGVWENWNVSNWHENTPIEMRNEDHVKWELYHLKNGITPVKVLEKELGNFRFQQKAVGEKFLISAHVYEPDLHSASSMEISVIPNEKPEILGIDITDVNNKPITNKLAYGQNINIHVRTVGMIGHHLNITLWEDDTDGAGHSDKNTKIVKFDKPARVGNKGIAHAQFQLSPNFAKMAKAIGDKNDSTHEYYVTAFGMGLLKASRNLNLIYPKERLAQTEDHLKGKKKETETIPPYKRKVPIQQPKTEAVQPSNIKKGISQVYFVDSNNRPITGTFKQTQLKAVIISSGLKGKDVKVTVYEEDEISNDTLFQKTVTISGDKTFVMVDLCEIPKSKGNDTAKIGGIVLYEDNIQELFVDVEVLETHTHLKSKTINVDSKAFKNDTPTGVSKLVIEDTKTEKGTNECFCKQAENKFYWSNKLTCDQRKKVLQVCKNLWPASKPNEKASELMAIIHLETGKYSFKPSADNGVGFSGLIQFSDASAKALGTTRSKLKAMTFTEQMDYVEKYLTKNKAKLNTMTDLYLMVLKPNAVGQGSNPNYVLFDESITVPDGDGSKTSDAQRRININQEPWVTKYGYASNPTYHLEKGEKELRKKWVYTRQRFEQRSGFVDGKTIVKDVTDVLLIDHYNLGKAKVFIGKCENIKEEKIESKERTPWMDIVVEEAKNYGGKDESIIDERIKTYHINGGGYSGDSDVAWCASFVCWCIEQKDYKSPHSAGSRMFLTSSNVEKCEVFYGCVAVFSDCDSTGTKMESKGHATFVFGKLSGAEVYACLGGNQGDMLKMSKYDCSGNVFVSWKTKKKTHYKIFRGFYKPKGYTILEIDKLTESDTYLSADGASKKALNLNIKSNESGESSR